MIYGSETGVLHGITYSCYSSFGIPASLCVGNNSNYNELTLDTIAPDLMTQRSIDEMKTPGGAVITFDTSSLLTNFMIANDDSGMSDSDINNDSINSYLLSLNTSQ